MKDYGKLLYLIATAPLWELNQELKRRGLAPDLHPEGAIRRLAKAAIESKEKEDDLDEADAMFRQHQAMKEAHLDTYGPPMCDYCHTRHWGYEDHHLA